VINGLCNKNAGKLYGEIQRRQASGGGLACRGGGLCFNFAVAAVVAVAIYQARDRPL
jgi:hypothetical protein